MRQNIYDDEEFAKAYDDMRKNVDGVSANDAIEIPIFRKMLGDVAGKSILDLGCGYGENDKYFKEQGASYVLGTDISNHMIAIASEKNKIDGVNYLVLAMEDIDSLNQKFDMVISSLAFHYVKDFEKLVKDIYNVLNDSGTLLFSQEHPIDLCIKYVEGMKGRKVNLYGKRFKLISDYNREGLREYPWYNATVQKYFRNFTTIINTLVNEGFIIDELNECQPTEEMIEMNPKYVNQYDSPYFLFVKAHKK